MGLYVYSCTIECDAGVLKDEGMRSHSLFTASSFSNTIERINLRLFFVIWSNLWENHTLCLLVSRVISSSLSLLCVVLAPDGSDQSFGATLRGHGGRELRHDGTEAAGQFGEEVLPRSANSKSINRATEHRQKKLHLVFTSLLPQRLLRHHGEVGRPREAERPLGQPGPEHVHPFALWRHHERLWKGQRAQDPPTALLQFGNFCQGFHSGLCFFVCFPQNVQKHVMTSDKWLDRLVSGGQGF